MRLGTTKKRYHPNGDSGNVNSHFLPTSQHESLPSHGRKAGNLS